MSIATTLKGFFINTNTPSLDYSVVGYRGSEVPEEYIVTISSARSGPDGNGIVVRAILQGDVAVRTGSKWESFINILRENQFVNTLETVTQLASNKSLQNAMTSRRIWRGTDPLTFTLELRFEEEYDAKTEVMDACRALHAMCLPDEETDGLGLLIPPGPSPFEGVVANAKRELIGVYIGRFLAFSSVIIKDVSVSFAPKIGTDGLSKSAKVSITFETYEILTKKRLTETTNGQIGVYSYGKLKDNQKYSSQYDQMSNFSGFKTQTQKQVTDTLGPSLPGIGN